MKILDDVKRKEIGNDRPLLQQFDYSEIRFDFVEK